MISIRKYQKEDFLEVKNLISEAFSIERKEEDVFGYYEIVACLDDKIVGYLLLTKVLDPIVDECYFLVDYVCVKREYQNQKIGKMLMDEAEKIARENQASYMQLTCSRFRKAAHFLYEECGFVVRDSDIFRKVL